MTNINPGIFVVIVDECNKVFILRMRYNWRDTPHVTMNQIKTFFSMINCEKERKKTYSYLICMWNNQEKNGMKIDLYCPKNRSLLNKIRQQG
jgi:hypothetical protein